MKKKIEFDEVCIACSGTGLYVGMGERDGAAVVCHDCKGTGCFHYVHEYEEFIERANKKGIKRVYQTNPGYCIGENERENVHLIDFGGMPYFEWKDGNKFDDTMQMRKHTCPGWWYQTIDYDKKPDWAECFSNLGATFSKCKYFAEKEDCWAQSDIEQGKKLTNDGLKRVLRNKRKRS
jgi:hypothetical protein